MHGKRVGPLGNVPDGWSIKPLGEITTKIGSGSTPRGGEAVYLPQRHQFAFVRSQNVLDYAFDASELRYISDEHARALTGVHLQSGDLLLNITGDGVTFGRCCIVPDSVLPAAVNQHVSIVRADQSVCRPGYLVAYLCHPRIKEYIETFNAGGSRRAITKGHIETFLVALPPLDVQAEVERIVDTILGKIAINNQLNETLEQLAHSIFQAWFVDFLPVRAKAAARSEGRDSLRAAMCALSGKDEAALDAMPREQYEQLTATAVLFPDKLVESELNEIPLGWAVGKLGDHVEQRGRTVTPAELRPEEPYFGLEHLPRKSIALDRWDSTSGLESGKRRFAQGTILFGKLRPYFHKVGVAPVAGVCSTDILALVPRSSSWFGFALMHLSSDTLIAYADRVSNGAKMPRVNWNDLAKYPVVAPSNEIVSRFDLLIREIVAVIRANVLQSRTLAELRDTLLPKLLSGEIQVGEAQELVDTAS